MLGCSYVSHDIRCKSSILSHCSFSLGDGGGLGSLLLNSLGLGGSSLLGVGGGDNVGRDSEFLNEVLDTGGSDGVVVPLPVEDVGKVASGGEGLDDHLGLEVGDLSDLLVLGKVGVLLDDNDALTEEVSENCSLFLLADKNHNNLCVY